MDFSLRPGTLLNLLLATIVALLCANIAVIAIRLLTGHDVIYGLIPLFDFNAEANVPSLFSALLMLVAAGLLALIARHERHGGYVWRWGGLAFVFLFLCIDETAQLHERLSIILKQDGEGASGFLYYAWVLPYGIALLVLTALYMDFLYRLPTATRWRFMLAGALFVSGAMGMEVLGGWQHERAGTDNWLYALMYTTEETLEMLGVSVFIYALLKHIGQLRVSVIDDARAHQKSAQQPQAATN